MVTPAAKREAAAHLCTVHGVSQRRACRAIGVDRALVRYRSRRPDDKAARARLRELPAVRRRFGWRRLQVLLLREGVRLNHKRLRRLYVEERLQVRRRIGRKRAVETRVPLVPARELNQRWSMDFVHDCPGNASPTMAPSSPAWRCSAGRRVFVSIGTTSSPASHSRMPSSRASMVGCARVPERDTVHHARPGSRRARGMAARLQHRTTAARSAI